MIYAQVVCLIMALVSILSMVFGSSKDSQETIIVCLLFTFFLLSGAFWK